jgi:hypothetical protein
MPRPQDILFGILGVAVIAMLAFGIQVVVLALLGAFVSGSLYLLAGMMPPRAESFWRRVFTSAFLATVLASLVLIVPGTFGPLPADAKTTVLATAGSLPLIAVCFEVVRTPQVMQGIRRCFGR